MSIKIKDVLNITSLKESVILSGTNNLNQQVTGVMVMEFSDVKTWLEPGQLILTSLYGLKNFEETYIEEFIKDIVTSNGAGLIVKLGRYVETMPQHLIDKCLQYEVLLIQIPSHTQYSEIITEVTNLIQINNWDSSSRQLELSTSMIIDLLLLQPNTDHVLLDDLLSRIGLNINNSYQFLLLKLQPSYSNSDSIKDIILSFRHFLPPFIYKLGRRYIILVIETDLTEKIGPSKIKKLLNQYSTKTSQLKQIIIGSIGKPNEFYSLTSKLLAINDLVNLYKISEFILSNDDINLLLLIHSYKQNDDIYSLIPDDLLFLYHNEIDLYNTLKIYLKNILITKDTAEEMFLHSKTVYYRINKLTDYIDIDFTNSQNILKYAVGIQIIDSINIDTN